jgi:DNA-binding transcriptional LysR family regulator
MDSGCCFYPGIRSCRLTARLEIVLPRFEPQPLPIHVVYREGRQALARVRAFVDLMVRRLRADLPLA